MQSNEEYIPPNSCIGSAKALIIGWRAIALQERRRRDAAIDGSAQKEENWLEWHMRTSQPHQLTFVGRKLHLERMEDLQRLRAR